MHAKSLAIFSILALCTLSQASGNTQQTFLTGGGCASIPGVGSPILMISNAHKFIEDALDIRNPYTQIRFIYFSQVAATVVTGQTNYKIAFALTDYFGTKYIGVDFSLSPFGIGSIMINRFILTKNLTSIGALIDPLILGTATLTCGDQKYVYSSYGKSPTSPLPYSYPGRNQTSAGLRVLNNLNSGAAGSSGSAVAAPAKVCVTANFIETASFFGTPGATTPIDLLNCLPNKNSVAAISIGCTNNVVTSLQLTYNNINDNGTTNSQLVGNPATTANNITTIPLQNADRISITAATTPDTITIQTLDATGNALVNYTCGTGTTAPTNVILTTSNFLGLTSITTDGTTIQSFQLTQYSASA